MSLRDRGYIDRLRRSPCRGVNAGVDGGACVDVGVDVEVDGDGDGGAGVDVDGGAGMDVDVDLGADGGPWGGCGTSCRTRRLSFL